MRAELYWVERPGTGGLAVMPRPRGGDWLEDEARSLAAEGVNVLVSLLTLDEAAQFGLEAEEAGCHAAGLEFVAYPLADRGVPASFTAICPLVEALAEQRAHGKAVAVHCRAGIGRASLLAACVLVASGDSARGAFERIERARGLSVPDTEEQRRWVESFAAWRAGRGRDHARCAPGSAKRAARTGLSVTGPTHAV
jgi:protein-tyrosine phosphatase